MKTPTLLILLIAAAMFNLFGQGKNNTDKEFNKMKGKIFPIIKVTQPTNGGSGTPKFAEGAEPVYKEVAGDLVCFYGVDRGKSFELLKKSQIPESVSIEQLNELAKANLIAGVQKDLEIHTMDFGGIGFTCGGNHEAALIMVPEIWDILIKKLGENIVFAAPSKDMCVYVKATSTTDIEKLKELVVDIQKEGGQLLSGKLYKYNKGKIEVFE